MPDILHDLPIRAAAARVFAAVSTPAGLDRWWTKGSEGMPRPGAEYALSFGPGYDWTAKVTRCEPDEAFELELVRADDDWAGTRVGVHLEPKCSPRRRVRNRVRNGAYLSAAPSGAPTRAGV